MSGNASLKEKQSYKILEMIDTFVRWIIILLKIYFFTKCNSYLQMFMDSIV